MALGESLVRLVGLGEGVAFRDWNLELRGLHRRVEALEFADSRDAVITHQCHAAPLLWRRLDAVGVRHTAVRPKRVQTFFQRVATSESQHGIDAIGCEAAGLVVDVDAFGIDDAAPP
jgi:hypothetical protein